MLFWTIVKVAMRSIAANKMRSVLTMLGVIIGVASVIAMLGLGAGAQARIEENMSAMGANLLTISPDFRSAGGVRTDAGQNLRITDAEAVLDEIREIEMVAPTVSGSYQVKFMNKNSRVSVTGTSTTYFPTRSFEVEKGRSFTEDEVNRQARVAVLGPQTATELFDEMEPLGQMIKVRGINFLVVGVTKSKGDQGWFNPDTQIFIPYTTAMSQILGRDSLNQIFVKVRDKNDMVTAQTRIEEVIRRTHRIQADQPNDFNVRNMQEWQDAAATVTRTFTALLAGVAAISLLVGGIGIMNIMLVTVTERTREIGVRKALGARRGDVMTQFLLEAMLLSLTGAMIGLAIGVGAILAANHFGQTSTIPISGKVDMFAVVLSFGFALFVGIFFGWYPARKASQLDPIEALRYE